MLSVKLTATAEDLAAYEWHDERDREWLVPAELLNTKGILRLIEDGKREG